MRCEPEFIGKTFNDFLFRPQYSKIRSRQDISLQSSLSSLVSINWPIFSANMDTVTSASVAQKMDSCGGIGFLHRNCSIEQQVERIKKVKKNPSLVGAAVGINGDYLKRTHAVVDAGADILLIDTAHGDSNNLIEAAYKIRIAAMDAAMDDDGFIRPYIMAGNVATYEGAKRLAETGIINGIKVGVGPGAACLTRSSTAAGVPQLQAIREVWHALRGFNINIIADGGIKEDKDIFLALACGADFIMLGSMISKTQDVFDETAGYFRGMASEPVQQEMGTYSGAPEGLAVYSYPHDFVTLPTIQQLADRIKGHLQSSLSYAGVGSIEELHCEITPRITDYLIPLSAASIKESYVR